MPGPYRILLMVFDLPVKNLNSESAQLYMYTLIEYKSNKISK